MCGLVGFWSGKTGSADEALSTLRAMRDRMIARGPDAAGEWSDGRGIWLGHRRLAILDLSEHGHQPMVSESDRFVVSYNGEIYNFRDLRAELEAAGHRFRGHSDTEVLLAAVERWGLAGAVSRFVGMFAFALVDRRERKLHLVRDRLGIKPLVWSRGHDGSLLFASDLRALEAHPGFVHDLDRDALASYLRYNCVPAPYTIYRNARKVSPGTIETFDGPASDPVRVVYWSAIEVARAGREQAFRGTDDEAAEALNEILREAVGARMIADVPLGAFLSGGIDSSTVVAVMQSLSSRPVKTFSIGNERADYDEAASATAVAKHLGTEHRTLMVTARDALEIVPKLPEIFDEPFADSSQIPTHIVSRLARQHVTVSLSGDGGDELFAGYNRHFWGPRIWSRARRTPRALRVALARAVLAIGPKTWDRGFELGASWLPNVRLPGQQMHKLASVLPARTSGELYHQLCSHWREPTEVVVGATTERPRPNGIELSDFAESMMLTDLVTYLPDDILTKVDRASMAVSLEARVPLLDHRVVEFGWRLPMSLKLRSGQGKYVLRRVLRRYVPEQLWERPKAGFGVPIGDWLRGPLRGWAEALLEPGRLRREGYLRPEPIRQAWQEHASGGVDHQHRLWDVLMFQAWLERRSLNA